MPLHYTLSSWNFAADRDPRAVREWRLYRLRTVVVDRNRSNQAGHAAFRAVGNGRKTDGRDEYRVAIVIQPGASGGKQAAFRQKRPGTSSFGRFGNGSCGTCGVYRCVRPVAGALWGLRDGETRQPPRRAECRPAGAWVKWKIESIGSPNEEETS